MMGTVEDDAYAAELLAVLTDPDPAQDDGIDRRDGFGRDLWVTSASVADGPHGAELVVEFEVALGPDLGRQGVPPRGSLRLPLDARWRELSGYDDPAAYAPLVAYRVEVAGREHVERHRPGRWQAPRPSLPPREQQWRLLVEALGERGELGGVAPGRVEVRGLLAEAITVVVTAEQWEQVLLERAWGDVGLYLDEALGAPQEDELFLVFWEGRLVRSTREELPPVRGRALERRVARHRAEHPGGTLGWYAYRPD